MNRSLKIPLVANARLAQKGEVLDLESELPGSLITGGNILSLDFFLFSRVKAFTIS